MDSLKDLKVGSENQSWWPRFSNEVYPTHMAASRLVQKRAGWDLQVAGQSARLIDVPATVFLFLYLL